MEVFPYRLDTHTHTHTHTHTLSLSLSLSLSPVITVSMSSNRYIEVHLVVGVIRLYLPEVPLDARASYENSREPPVQSLLDSHHTNIHQTLLPDTVMGQQLKEIRDHLHVYVHYNHTNVISAEGMAT